MIRHPQRIGLGLTGEGLAISDVIELGTASEEAGLDGFWHGENQREPWVPLSAVASRTQRIRIGTAVALWARGLVPTDHAAANLDELASGRLVLGLGTGPRQRNEDWFAIPYENPVERMREFVELLRSMWQTQEGRSLHYTGTHLSLRNYTRTLRPYRERIPVYLGGTSRGMLRLAGQIADGVLLDVLTTPVELAERAIRHVRVGATQAGRRLADLEVGSMVLAAVSDDCRLARHWARGQIAYYVRGSHADPTIRRHGFERQAHRVRQAAALGDTAAMISAVDDRMVDTLALVGTADQVRERLQAFDELDLIVLVPPAFELGRDEIIANTRGILEAFT